eukprot:CAMPEP_0198492500 /NCGR_PEP_ID=MMETSP1462-20131121/3459_1 /TAXON_ID=1333877 /ORGANISM="Brandtodinium nutriculum, Strain RCC3387" /LENGTH=88 /DNA_ID=CAMNT_0044221145 /DNA_START=31 /DNA_END=294 /DNA_ORIENTATION=-
MWQKPRPAANSRYAGPTRGECCNLPASAILINAAKRIKGHNLQGVPHTLRVCTHLRTCRAPVKASSSHSEQAPTAPRGGSRGGPPRPG